ncbi:interleukin-18 receptor accessory protein-like [Notolabrus celidotus]|uniref:interleukin-18 receptor accessory protein-like n=1 Tax=Notolabrus celidotus TaxID=1203425 RepID=UPI0014905A7C|nr:interleukin-18 receptor accessory protein-like [Notolabrus celidotus]
MKTGSVVFFLILPMSLEACCGNNHPKKRTGLMKNMTHMHYKAVEGEHFMIPCLKPVHQLVQVVWSRIGKGKEDHEGLTFNCGRKFLAEAKYSGNYTCLQSGSKLFFYLQVVKRNSSGRFSDEDSRVYLLIGQGAKIQCPGLDSSDHSEAVWYKESKAVSEQQRASCEENGELRLCKVSEHDTGVYFCDRQVQERGVTWTLRRAVNATAVPHLKPSGPPSIMFPDGSGTEEAELGHSHTLTCEVSFPFERTFSPTVRWFMHHNGNTENMTEQHTLKPQQAEDTIRGYTVTQRSIIREVTTQHFNNTFTCIATNSVGNDSITIKLKKKIKGQSVVVYPVASLLLVAGLGVALHVKWLELRLIYRSYVQQGNRDEEEREFDVFLSFVWSDSSAGDSTLLPPSECFSRLRSEDEKFTHRPLEVLLPQVLEDMWGYRLCLLERDVLPGGAYTHDVVLSIQRSRMLVCLLSADYLSSSSAVFVLESGVKALLQSAGPKLLLIWTSRSSASLLKPDPPLPVLVQRALKVLPSLDWTSGKSAGATKNFWKSLLRAMPDPRKSPNRHDVQNVYFTSQLQPETL